MGLKGRGYNEKKRLNSIRVLMDRIKDYSL